VRLPVAQRGDGRGDEEDAGEERDDDGDGDLGHTGDRLIAARSQRLDRGLARSESPGGYLQLV
jgi:hypothetical protein